MTDIRSQGSVDGIPTAVPGSDGTTTISIRGRRDLFRDIEPFIKYIVSGVLLIIVINISCCIILKRHVSQKNFKRSHNTGNELQGTFEEVESPVKGDERALRPISQRDDAGYADITKVESLYADHAEDEYHVLSFSRNRRVTTKQNNSSIYHHVDINMIKKDQTEPAENGSSTSVEEVQTTLHISVSQQNEIDEIVDTNPVS